MLQPPWYFGVCIALACSLAPAAPPPTTSPASTPAADHSQPRLVSDPTDPNRERLPLDESVELARWYNGSPEETALARAARGKIGGWSLEFANRVDHARGEKNYPVGWPRCGLNLGRSTAKGQARPAVALPTDWSGFDYFECWIYTQTSREALPATPLGLGFSHSKSKHRSSFPLKQVAKDRWIHVEIPLSKLADARDVHAIQFHIAESNYRHGDRVVFYLADLALSRYRHPVVAELGTARRVHFVEDRDVTVVYTLLGRQGLADSRLKLEVGQGAASPLASAEASPSPAGELSLVLPRPLAPGDYWARLSVLRGGQTVHRREVRFRAVAGPFAVGN